jgi:Bardet-Biedl syndrome 2 protein
MCYGESLPDVG